jgi:alpha-glucoside transport system permease protein
MTVDSQATTSVTAPPPSKPPEHREGSSAAMRSSFSSPLASLIVVIITVLWTIPTVGLLITSIRPQKDVASSGWWTFFTHPSFTLDNYSNVLSGNNSGGGGLAPFFVNSFIITIPGALFPLALACMAAYALAWVPFRGNTFVFFAIFALQVVPLQMSLLPLLQIFTGNFSVFGFHVPTPHLAGISWMPYLPVWIAHTMFALPLAVFLLHNFIAQLPRDLFEAARVDGASHFLIFRKIVLPLSTPAIASFAIFQFLWVWNDLLVSLTFAGGGTSVEPLTARLSQLTGAFGSKWELLTAGAFIAIIVPLIVFFSLQRFFVRGLLAGSVKG